MQIIKCFTKWMFFICPFFASAQSTYLQQGDKAYQLLERLEIKGKTNPELNFSHLRYLNRKNMVTQVELMDSLASNPGGSDSLAKAYERLNLSKTDRYNITSFLMNNAEWATRQRDQFASKKPVLKHFYQNKAVMFEVNTKDFYLSVNPMLQLTYGKENNNDDNIFVNSRGITARGLIARKIGFSTTLIENQERGPLYFRERINRYRAVPGVGFYKGFKNNGVDYFDARGYITFSATKYINFQFGHDKNFIGNGYRSLFLSDWSNSYLFFKINTRIWKFNYQNIFQELIPMFGTRRGDQLQDRKYQVVHHLGFNISKNVTIGLFEAVTYGRKNRFDFQYLNPIIFLRHVEGGIGSADKAKAGFDFKANVANKFQFYGQFLLDEFVLSKLRKEPNNYVNKYGYQLGMKYVDAFGVSNLDIQVETNRVKPFTYSHRDSVSNYTHYNQPMAHPLGANFHEWIGIVKYQPAPKWYVYARTIYYKQGLDSAGYNFGANPFRLYSTGRPPINPNDPNSLQRDNPFPVGGGNKANCLNALLQLSYEFRENMYLDLNVQHRTFKTATPVTNSSSTLFTAGVRINIWKREYDF